MKLVVDTNLVFSALLNTNSKIADLLLNSVGLLSFFSPDILLVEIDRHRAKLLELSKMTDEELDVSLKKISSKINWVPEADIPFSIWSEAIPLVRDVDMDDLAFVACSRFLDVKLWTGDKALMKGLLLKGFQNVILTDEVFQIRELLK